MDQKAYIISLGTFLPGEPVPNREMVEYLGEVPGTSPRVRERILKQNGITSRYYAIDKEQHSLYSNSEMAARASERALENAGVEKGAIEFLASATSQGDHPLPGFASMIHGDLRLPRCEIASLHGVCASGMAAMLTASLHVKDGKSYALACASEFPSRLFKSSRYLAQRAAREGNELSFDTEFLRWMLSDGAGAAVLSSVPKRSGLSLRIEWSCVRSYANLFPVCMYVGPERESQYYSWLDYPSYQDAADDGAINLRQDTRMLKDVLKCAVDGLFELADEGRFSPDEIDWFLPHYSSEVFRGDGLELLRRSGFTLSEDRIFTNLHTKGNVGSASLYLMLEELFYSGKLTPGERILCLIPESGRFSFGYMLLTVVGESGAVPALPETSVNSEIVPPTLNVSSAPIEASLVRQLTRVWIDFENRLAQVPIISRMQRAQLTVEDYRELLFNLRQQVIDGSRWISRAASNVSEEFFPIRSAFIAHSGDEHRDYEMLERNYVAVGGSLEEIRAGHKNIGSAALSAYILERASHDNPFDLIGAMYIIEGLGQRVAHRWGCLIREQLKLKNEDVSFLIYHGVSDEQHFKRLDAAIALGILTPELVSSIVKTAKVTARLYVLQLEEIGNS